MVSRSASRDVPHPADAPSDQTDLHDRDEAREVEALVGEWAYLPDIAERYRLPITRVRRFVADRELLTHRVGPNRALAVPAGFLGPDGPRPELKGTFTVLADGGMGDLEIIRWLHTVDTSLPGGSTPLHALDLGHKTEVRRRAQALAF
ncbi:MAG TPA: Rv2175c family DNA-binding protein [Dermatophilaceae bacterium]|nr:Rv2175c family DNA-binding protein [Dermatophilaceae bacterium]